MDGLTSPSGAWALFISAFISSTIAPGGSEVALAYMVTHSALSPAFLLGVATTGNTLGALTTWVLGALAAMGYPLGRWAKRGHPKALATVRKWGTLTLLFSWLPIVGDGLCLAAGWLRLPFLPSLLAITVGKAARYALIIFTLS